MLPSETPLRAAKHQPNCWVREIRARKFKGIVEIVNARNLQSPLSNCSEAVRSAKELEDPHGMSLAQLRARRELVLVQGAKVERNHRRKVRHINDRFRLRL